MSQLTHWFLLLGTPLLFMWAEKRRIVFHRISPIIGCYAVGILLGNLSVFQFDQSLSTRVSEVSILLAIPLLLYSCNVLRWLSQAKTVLYCFTAFVVAGLLTTTALSYFNPFQIEEISKAGGMITGLFTGGIPNLQAVGMALEAPQEQIILLNTSDVIVGGSYFLWILAFGPLFFGRFLPAYQAMGRKETDVQLSNSFVWLDSIKALLITVVIVGGTIGLTILIFGKLNPVFIMLILTTFSLIASFVPTVNKLKSNYPTAIYFLLVFSMALGMLANLEGIIREGLQYVAYVGVILISTVFIHLIWSRWMSFDRDTVMIVGMACLYGPAFIGQVADRLKNQEIIITGILCGLFGYLIGNYLGISMAYFLESLITLKFAFT